METFLQIVEVPTQSDEEEMDPERLKSFNCKLNVWYFAKISASEFQNLPCDGKSSILKKYYVEMSKHPDAKAKIIFAWFLADFCQTSSDFWAKS